MHPGQQFSHGAGLDPQRVRAVLDRLDSSAIEVENLSIHSPDLDDVFLALTGDATRERQVS